MSSFTPLYNKVVVKRDETADQIRGLLIPEIAQRKPYEGVVLSVGCGLRNMSGEIIPLIVKAGDKVVFGAGAGFEIDILNEKVLVMSEGDILGVIND